MTLEDRLNRIIDTAIEAGRIVGTVILVRQNGAPVFTRAAGMADREAQTAIELDTIFRFASVTKPLVAATALAMIEKGLFSLDSLVSDHLDWFQPLNPDGTLARMTIRHLLTHTSGMAYDPELERLPPDLAINCGLSNTDLDFETNFSRFNKRGLAFEPGTQWAYSPSTDVLGALIAKVHGGTLEETVSHYITAPLGMVDTHFHVTDMKRLAIPYADGEKAAIRMPDPWVGRDPDGWTLSFSPARLFNPRAYQSGGAGMVGTAGDFMTFLECLRTGGAPVLGSEIVSAGMSNQIGLLPYDPGMRFGFFGAVVTDSALSGQPSSPGTVRWGGVYGNSWFVDPANGLSMVLMSNTALEGCTGVFPVDITKAIYG
jgi:CubicO group peptidase (beta-lactamase class C family)